MTRMCAPLPSVAAQRNCCLINAHRDRIAAEEALVQHRHARALDKSQLDQPPFELGRGQAELAGAHPDGPDPAAEPDRSVAERRRRYRGITSSRRGGGQARK